MSIEIKAIQFLNAYYRDRGKLASIGYSGLAEFAQSQRDDMREQAAKVADKYPTKKYNLAQEIRDLK